MLMLRALKAMIAEVTAAAEAPAPAGATLIHGIASRFIDEHDDVTAVQLAAHLHVTKQSASEIVGLLEREGFVQRHPHPKDGRARVLELTDAGREGLAASRRRWDAVVARWGELAGPDDLTVVRQALEAYLLQVPDPLLQ
jgi:DNA-binding MarR family transcriptional regulator